MASREALSIQSEKHMVRIEEHISNLTGLQVGQDLTPLPRRHKDPYQHTRDLLSNIADWLDRVPTENAGCNRAYL